MRWTHHVEAADAGLHEQMWRILAAESPQHRRSRDLSVRIGLLFVAGAVPFIAVFVWLFASAFGLVAR